MFEHRRTELTAFCKNAGYPSRQGSFPTGTKYFPLFPWKTNSATPFKPFNDNYLRYRLFKIDNPPAFGLRTSAFPQPDVRLQVTGGVSPGSRVSFHPHPGLSIYMQLRRHHAKHGMSLIEILCVIGIIAILAAFYLGPIFKAFLHVKKVFGQ